MTDPVTLTREQVAAMSDNEYVLNEHPENKVIGPQSNKPAESGMDLSDCGIEFGLNLSED